MSDSQSDFQQKIFGNAANAAGLISLLGPVVQAAGQLHAHIKPDPAKNVKKVRAELDSFCVLLEKDKNVVENYEEFDKRFMRIQLKFQKETNRIDQSSGSRSERCASINNLRRISTSVQEIRRDFITSSANARNMSISRVSTIQENEDNSSPTTTNTSRGIASIPRKVYEMCSFKSEKNVLPTHIEPGIPQGGQPPQSIANVQEAPDYYLAFNQPDGTERLVHSTELINNPGIAPELVDILIRTVKAYQQGVPVMSAPLPSGPPVQEDSRTANGSVQATPIFKVNLECVAEMIDAEDTMSNSNV